MGAKLRAGMAGRIGRRSRRRGNGRFCFKSVHRYGPARRRRRGFCGGLALDWTPGWQGLRRGRRRDASFVKQRQGATRNPHCGQAGNDSEMFRDACGGAHRGMDSVGAGWGGRRRTGQGRPLASRPARNAR